MPSRVPVWIWIGLGAGAYLVYVSTKPGVGGLGALLAGIGGSLGLPGQPIGLTAAQRAALLTFAPHVSPGQGAAVGAGAGAPLAGPTFGISVGVGALVGYFAAKQTNDTKIDRQTFAHRLGFQQLGGEVNGNDQTVYSLTGRNSLYGYLTFIGRSDLTDFAMHIIGRQDYTDNQTWFANVITALQTIGFPFPA